MAWMGRCLLLGAVIAFLVLGGLEAWWDSATYDEPVYVASGVATVLHHDVEINDEHPPLFKVLAVLPVLAVQPVVPADGHWNLNDERSYSARFVDAQLRAGKMHAVTVASRLVPLLETAAVGLALFALASMLFGPWAGLVAALLWLLSPLVLGIGHLDGVDMPSALTCVLVSLTLVRWLRQRSRPAAVWLGLACGLAVAAQDTGLLLAALVAAVMVIAGWRRGQRRWSLMVPAVGVAVVTWLVLWVSYVVVDPASVLHPWLIFPHAYVDGIRYLGSHDTGGSPGFLLGQAWSGISVWFWPATLLVKLSTPVLLLLVLGTITLIALARSHRVDVTVWRYALAAVALPALVLFVFELTNPKTLGARYLLPSIALWCVLASPVALLAGRRLMTVALAVVLAAAAAALATSFPHSIAYTAPPFRPSYRVATDSNVDWGQDFGALVSWSRTHLPYVAYFGPRGLGTAQIPGSRSLVGASPPTITGWVAASASDLTSADRHSLAWLRGYCPVGTLGGSILLYHFTSPPTARPGPVTPAPMCAGSVSHRVSS
jgi:4-amino-4-deoxy-L-arabinose transferase-like glycosyltransferase